MTSAQEPCASVVVDAHHSQFVDTGAATADPTAMEAGYECAPPDPGTLLLVGDNEGWATLHRVIARGAGRIEFGPRIPWPDGSIAARKIDQ